jgi:YD repeat-containing protein
MDSTCQFNEASNQGTCDVTYSDNFGGAGTARTVVSYNSTNDFIDEVRVVPPLTRSTRATTQTNGFAGTTASGTVTNSYDAQNRLVRQAAAYTIGSATTTYTAWDSAGRPTAGTLSGGGAGTMEMSYDDAARSVTITTKSFGGETVCTSVYDANGNQVSVTCAGTSTVGTISQTQTVCR